MSPAALRRIAGFLVLGLVFTSLPVRVWLFGACPICGGIHTPVIVFHVGPVEGDPTPGDDPTDDPPACPHDHDTHGCFPPLPYGPTTSPPAVAVLKITGEVHPESDPLTASVPAAALIRPPRA